jgi:hypothetical protein
MYLQDFIMTVCDMVFFGDRLFRCGVYYISDFVCLLIIQGQCDEYGIHMLH